MLYAKENCNAVGVINDPVDFIILFLFVGPMPEFRCYNVVFRKVFAQKCSEFVIKYLVMDCVPLASVAQRHKNSFKRRKMP